MIKVGIIGATGYVGLEITRILSTHPNVEITSLVSKSYAGRKISAVYPSLKNVLDLECESLDIDKLCDKADFFITALPHGVSEQVIPELINRGKRVIDHSADFRYRDIEVYEKWYGRTHAMPQLVDKAVYGLPELYRDKLKDAVLVANPGCYPTCSILALAPLVKHKLINLCSIIIDAASGITGAGRKADLMYQFCERSENYRAYGVATHRHTSEIEQEISLLAGEEVILSFTPHLLPVKRGILCTRYADLANKCTTSELLEVYKQYYKDEFFVRISDEGQLPELKDVSGSNFIDIGLVVDERLDRVIVLSALDNLVKGAAGQAVQVLNIMNGFPEKAGLDRPGMYL